MKTQSTIYESTKSLEKRATRSRKGILARSRVDKMLDGDKIPAFNREDHPRVFGWAGADEIKGRDEAAFPAA
ncbi:hypothetical protein N7492_009854 [Penicillium capsulatum]|uniref:Uncharacterized protein n=1 Tax=Penicillium capsulatum TaxID=69766 RepID=A0A9W9HQ00_9EURO|nr:hypothetical protein N7492_009854 [Penicillium capsulatum]KAJ6112365.1 hypothetical protein N7512_007689 [Penicillium capsulatum]